MSNSVLIAFSVTCIYILISILIALLVSQNESDDKEITIKSLLWIFYYPYSILNFILTKVRVVIWKI